MEFWARLELGVSRLQPPHVPFVPSVPDSTGSNPHLRSFVRSWQRMHDLPRRTLVAVLCLQRSPQSKLLREQCDGLLCTQLTQVLSTFVQGLKEKLCLQLPTAEAMQSLVPLAAMISDTVVVGRRSTSTSCCSIATTWLHAPRCMSGTSTY